MATWLTPLTIAFVLFAPPVAALFGPDDDAGTGADAPETETGAPTILAGETYRGRLLTSGDVRDTYAFDAPADGDLVLVIQADAPVCFVILQDGQYVDNTITCLPTNLEYHVYPEVPSTGTLHLRFVREGTLHHVPVVDADASAATPVPAYRFSFEA